LLCRCIHAQITFKYGAHYGPLVFIGQVSVNFEVFTTQKRPKPFHLQQFTMAAERAVFPNSKEIHATETNQAFITRL
jgi:hypothetical protein